MISAVFQTKRETNTRISKTIKNGLYSSAQKMTQDDKTAEKVDARATFDKEDNSTTESPCLQQNVSSAENLDAEFISAKELKSNLTDNSSSKTPSTSSYPSNSSFSDQDAQPKSNCPDNVDFSREASVVSNAVLAKDNLKPSMTKPSEGCATECQSRTNSHTEEHPICYDPVLDDEIRNRLDKLNALSDLINSLELRFDQANALFRETLKCSTERLSSIAKSLGSKSIRKGRIYHEAKISVEQTQSECQRACVQFEQANNDHQYAKLAIREAESKLHEMNSVSYGMATQCSRISSATSLESINVGNLKLEHEATFTSNECDRSQDIHPSKVVDLNSSNDHNHDAKVPAQILDETTNADATVKLMNSAKLSEDLNRAIIKLVEAEEKRRQSEKMHLDQANKLMMAQENLTKLEREHGTSIRRAQVYFEEARRFNARLNSVKNDIARVSEDIAAAKKSYARTLEELEQFSEDLHINGRALIDRTSSPPASAKG